MKNQRNIVAGVAFRADTPELSEGSVKAARQAAWLARENGGNLVLLHSTHPDERGEAGDRDHRSDLTEDEHATLESLAGELARGLASCRLSIVEGKAWREIASLVLAGETDLVVVGKRNGSSEGEPRLGSVAAKLVRNCPGPVWCVRPEHDLALRLVLAASDLSEVGGDVCRSAAWIAERHGCELHLLHAYSPPAAGSGTDKASAARKRARAGLLASVAGSSVEPVTHLVKGKASAAVREAVEHLGPDLLVLGATSRGETGHLLGDTAERIVSRVACSLLTLKPGDFVSPLA